MPPMLTIAHLTLAEALRRRIVTAGLLCGLAFLAVFAAAVFFAFARGGIALQPPLQQQLNLAAVTVVGLYAASFLSILFAVLLPVDALSGEIDSGVMQTLAAKPVRRADIVLGKWLGHWVIVVLYLVLICVAVAATTSLAGRTMRLDLSRTLPLLGLEATFMMTLSIAGGTRLSTVTNGIVGLGFFGVGFLGGWIEQIGALTRVDTARTVGIVASLLSPGDSMWRLGVYYLQPAISRGVQVGPFGTSSVPSPLMVWWTIGFTVLALVYAVRSFRKRAL
jgi:ABC-2 type transport system permease protein